MVAPPYRLSPGNFPLGFMYIAASMERAGFHVDVIDMDVLNLPEKDYIQELRERNYDYFCTGGMITAWNFIKFSSEAVKQIKPHVKVIIGGGIISSTPKSFLSTGAADVGIIGEGEDAVVEVIQAFESQRPISDVTGITYRSESGEVIETAKRTNLPDLDSLPYPAWDLFNVGEVYCRYSSHPQFWKAKRLGSVYTTRGCPFMCTFCYTEKSVRQRSVPGILDEISELKNRYNVQHVSFTDDLFVVRKKRTVEFCEALIKADLGVTWSATGRCNIVDPEFCKLMYRAGCRFLGLGIESGSDKVLKAIKKSQTPAQIVEAVKMVQKAGIKPGGTFILGLPPETEETIRETIDVYKQINSYRTHVNRFFFATPYPGTELYDQMVAKNRIGDEIKYFEKISEVGDAVDFLINCTDNLSDEYLKAIKPVIEKDVFEDFMKKHPLYWLTQFVAEKTPLGKINKALVTLKMQGFEGCFNFLRDKILMKLKLIPNRYQRRWNRKLSYAQSQTLFEGNISTY